MPKITKKQIQMLEKLTKKKDDLMDKIFDLAIGGHLRFDECLSIASPDLQERFNTARDNLFDYQSFLVSENRGRWEEGLFLRFVPYYH